MNQIQQLAEYAQALGCEARFDEPMSRHTTFRIGGPADLFLTVNNVPALQKICSRAKLEGIRLFLLGNGSNLLVSDAGIRGAVLTLGSKFKEISLCGKTAITCGAGASLASLCSFAREHSLTGLEFAWGIPGSVGGAIFMDAGAYGGSMADVTLACSHITKNGETGTQQKTGLSFGYRHSCYMENGDFITSARLELQPGSREAIAARMDDLAGRRSAKQPLELPSAGSVFKRPEGHFAGALIEQCGLKGQRVGGAAVSEKHAGFIVNLGGATCADVQKLIEIIQGTVFRETGIQLQCEIQATD